MSDINRIATGLLLAGILPGLFSPAASAQDDVAGYADKGAQTCLMCHNRPPVTLIFNTPHAQKADARTPFAGRECEACHGASPEHVNKLDSPAVVFGEKTSRFEPSEVSIQNKTCLSCHESGLNMNWNISQHQFADVSCASCHTIHSPNDKVQSRDTQSEVCFTCHKDKRAQMHRRSRHPIREGRVVCADCHNPHGSPGPSQLARNSINDTCYECHAEKRGPFLWEHQPVREDCTNCHDPHGSTQPRLLKVRQPWLCQQCHQEAFHPSTLYSGSDIPPAGAGQQLLGKSCTNCHSTIHGSNHPSGPRFTR